MKQRFGLVLVFMATRSGLTRWQDISVNSENETENFNFHFSDVSCRAIDETWYKRAVEQYLVDPESFVYSVPFDAEDNNSTLVTATHAIFHSDGSRQAPAAVTGFQFHQAALHARFMNITSTVHPSCDNESCNKTCADSEYDCYILDNNGYIIVSENRKYTGIFFGEVKSGIMERLVKDNVYKKKIIHDYQAVCFVTTEKNEPSHSNKLNSPIVYVKWLANWVFGHILWLLVQANLQWIAATAMSYSAGELYPETYDENSEPSNSDSPTKNGERIVTKMMINRTRPQPCQMKVNLYLLQPIKSEGRPTKSEEKQKHRTSNASCDRPYVLKSIPYSNLVMVVVNSLCPIGSVENMQIVPVEVKYNETKCCKTDAATQLPRRRPKDCINTHLLEENITMCGRGSQHFPDKTIVLILYFIIYQFRTYC